MKKREITIPTLVGLMVVLGGLLSGLWMVQRQISRSSRAASDSSPQEVVLANISDTSFTVTWTTQKSGAGYIQYGESTGTLDLMVSDDRDQQKGMVENYFTHYVTVRGLKPDTMYRFKIGSGGHNYDQDGTPYEVKTGASLAETPTADVAYGQVVTANGEPAGGALVYLTMSGGNVQAALTKSSGSWVIPLSTIRTGSLNSFVLYDKSVTKIDIDVNNGPMGKAKITTVTANDSPVPQIVLGQDQNYSESFGQTPPTATASGQQNSKLGQISAPEITEKELKLLTPQSGEAVNSNRPEIIGVAPANAEITIEIHSEALVSGTTTADRQGNFTFSVPQDLPPGEHTITISTIVDGVVQRVTRSFTVYAQGESFDPAFSSTPSATLSPTTRPTPTVVPIPTTRATATPRPTATATPTVTPRLSTTPKPTATLTPSPTTRPTATPTILPAPTSGSGTTLPESGGAEVTMLLLLVGLGLLSSGWWWYRKAV